VPYPLVHPDSIAGREHAVAPSFPGSRSDDGLHAAWVHRLVILRGPPDVEPPIEARLTAVGDQSAIEGHRS
jgi:hypothetical protein